MLHLKYFRSAAIQYSLISFVWFPSLPCFRVASFCFIPFCCIVIHHVSFPANWLHYSCQFILFNFVSFQFAPSRIVSFHTIPFKMTPLHFFFINFSFYFILINLLLFYSPSPQSEFNLTSVPLGLIPFGLVSMIASFFIR